MSDINWSPSLWEDEHVLWQERPIQNAYVFSWIDLYWGLFILGSIQFALADPSTRRILVSQEIDSYVVPLVTIFLISLVFWKRLVADRQRRLRHVYAVTNKRALVANLHSNTVEASIRLTYDLDVFVTGIAYRYVVFTGKKKMYWRLFRGIMIDGPPDVMGYHKSRDVHFLALDTPDAAFSVATSVIGRPPE